MFCVIFAAGVLIGIWLIHICTSSTDNYSYLLKHNETRKGGFDSDLFEKVVDGRKYLEQSAPDLIFKDGVDEMKQERAQKRADKDPRLHWKHPICQKLVHSVGLQLMDTKNPTRINPSAYVSQVCVVQSVE